MKLLIQNMVSLRCKLLVKAELEKLGLLPNVLITGHQSFLTNEALRGIAETTFKNLTEFFQNGSSKNDLTL